MKNCQACVKGPQSRRQFKGEDAPVAGDVEPSRTGKDGGEVPQPGHAVPRSVSRVYLVTRIGPEAMQSVIAFRAYCPDNRFGFAICSGDDRGAPTVHPSTPDRV
jgi:hypothetical protein